MKMPPLSIKSITAVGSAIITLAGGAVGIVSWVGTKAHAAAREEVQPVEAHVSEVEKLHTQAIMELKEQLHSMDGKQDKLGDDMGEVKGYLRAIRDESRRGK